jgi:hypothetical protein
MNSEHMHSEVFIKPTIGPEIRTLNMNIYIYRYEGMIDVQSIILMHQPNFAIIFGSMNIVVIFYKPGL